MGVRCIIFDCDGVILESVSVKNDAFARLGGDISPEAQEKLLQYHLANLGVSRFAKFAWLYHELYGRDITAEESGEMGTAFACYCLEAVQAAPFVPGFLDVLDRWQGVVPMYVASGTPQAELAQVLEMRGIVSRFAGIYGTPPEKKLLLEHIIADAGVSPGATIMVGDSSTDMRAAEHAGTLFYGRGSHFSRTRYPWHADLTQLNNYLEFI